MKNYRVYKLTTHKGGIVKGKNIEVADDSEAMQKARADSDCPICEVWQSARKIGLIG